jgi:formamidopyrimidine-DNA glycosylase
MPELPEVETTMRGVSPHITGQTIAKVIVRQPKLRWPVPAALAKAAKGRAIKGVKRRAKYLLIELDGGHIVIHLGMSGSLRIIKAVEPATVHDHVDIVLANGTALRLRDPRRFGAVLWVTGEPEQHKLLAHLGPEPLSEDFDGELLYQLSRNRKCAVKTFLMDGKIVVGVGNIYANEALFSAGISPHRKAGSISKARYQRLAEEVKLVLAAAIKVGGTTLKDFVDGDGKPGYFKNKLKVYGRDGQPCLNCNRSLSLSRLGQRATVYSTACQK